MLQVRRLAHIMGGSSAAAKAVQEYERRSAAGEHVRFFQDVRSKAIVVGPHPGIEIDATSNGRILLTD